MFLQVPTFSLQHMPNIVPGPGIIIIREIDYNAIKKNKQNQSPWKRRRGKEEIASTKRKRF